MAPKTEKKGFLIYTDNTPWVDMLTDEECGKLLKLLMRYAHHVMETGERPLLYLARQCADGTGNIDERVQLVFGFMADSIWRDTEKWKRAKKIREERFSAAAYFNEEKCPIGHFDDGDTPKTSVTVVRDLHEEPVPLLLRDI